MLVNSKPRQSKISLSFLVFLATTLTACNGYVELYQPNPQDSESKDRLKSSLQTKSENLESDSLEDEEPVNGLFLEPITTLKDAELTKIKQPELPYQKTFMIESQAVPFISGNGSNENPFLVPNGDLDQLMLNLTTEWGVNAGSPRVRIILKAGRYYTRGHVLSGRANPRSWTLPSGWLLEGSGDHESIIQFHSELMLPANIDQNLVLISGNSPNGSQKAKNQIIRNLTLNGGFSKFASDYQTTGKALMLHGIMIYGDQSGIENVHFENFGSNKYESFVASVVGSHTRSWPVGTTFDAGWIVNCLYQGSVSPLNKAQISVFGVSGSGNKGPEAEDRSDYFRTNAYMAGNRVIINPGVNGLGGESNMVQGFTFYRVDGGTLIHNETVNAAIGYYSDWWEQRNITIKNNRFLNAANGIAIHADQMPGFRQMGFQITDNLITLEPYRDGARMGIRIRRANMMSESFKYYENTLRPRLISDFEIKRNFIFYSRPPSALENFKYSIGAQEVQGLTISDNLIDSRFFFGMLLTAIERKTSTGDFLKLYPNEGLQIENNQDRDVLDQYSFCKDEFNIQRQTISFNGSTAPKLAVIREEAEKICREHGGEFFLDSIGTPLLRNSAWSYPIQCAPVICLGAN